MPPSFFISLEGSKKKYSPNTIIKLVNCIFLEESPSVRRELEAQLMQKSQPFLGFDVRDLRLYEVTLNLWIKNSSIHISLSSYANDLDKNANLLLKWSERIYSFLSPDYGYSSHENEGEGETSEDTKTYLANRISWLNFYGPKRVAKIGRDKLFSTPVPCGEIKEMPDGGIMLRAYGPPYKYSVLNELNPEEATALIKQHLGLPLTSREKNAAPQLSSILRKKGYIK